MAKPGHSGNCIESCPPQLHQEAFQVLAQVLVEELGVAYRLLYQRLVMKYVMEVDELQEGSQDVSWARVYWKVYSVEKMKLKIVEPHAAESVEPAVELESGEE